MTLQQLLRMFSNEQLQGAEGMVAYLLGLEEIPNGAERELIGNVHREICKVWEERGKETRKEVKK